MANRGKKISELTALVSASLDTTIVGVDNGVTYKIELDTLSDAVTSRVNILDRNRLSALENYTSSFVAPVAQGTISSSAQITFLGFISSSTDITSLNSFTQSFSSSQASINIAFTNGINGRLTTSSFNSYTASQSTSSLVSRLNTIESVSGSWITESETGSFLTSLSGAISASSQLTSSFDTRYAISASFVSSSNLSSIQTITSASYAALTPVSGTLYIIIG
jgi:hypothetical protein